MSKKVEVLLEAFCIERATHKQRMYVLSVLSSELSHAEKANKFLDFFGVEESERVERC